MNSNIGMVTPFSNATSCLFWRSTSCLQNFHFVSKFLRIIWTHPTQHILLLAPWKIEVGVLFLDDLLLLHFSASLIVEEIPIEQNFLEIVFSWGPSHMYFYTTLEGLWPQYMILEVSWDSLWTLLLGSHNFMVMARVWSGPKPWYPMPTSKLDDF